MGNLCGYGASDTLTIAAQEYPGQEKTRQGTPDWPPLAREDFLGTGTVAGRTDALSGWKALWEESQNSGFASANGGI